MRNPFACPVMFGVHYSAVPVSLIALRRLSISSAPSADDGVRTLPEPLKIPSLLAQFSSLHSIPVTYPSTVILVRGRRPIV